MDGNLKVFERMLFKLARRGELEEALWLPGNVLMPIALVDRLRKAWADIVPSRAGPNQCPEGGALYKAGGDHAPGARVRSRALDIRGVFAVVCSDGVYYFAMPMIEGEENLYGIIALLVLACMESGAHITLASDVACLLLATINARRAKPDWATPLLNLLFPTTRFDSVTVTTRTATETAGAVAEGNTIVDVVYSLGGVEVVRSTVTLVIDYLHAISHGCKHGAPDVPGAGMVAAFIEQDFSLLSRRAPPLRNAGVSRFLDSLNVILKNLSERRVFARRVVRALVRVMTRRAATLAKLADMHVPASVDLAAVAAEARAATTEPVAAPSSASEFVNASSRMASQIACLRAAASAAMSLFASGHATRAAAAAEGSAAAVAEVLEAAFAAVPRPLRKNWPKPAMTIEGFQQTADLWTRLRNGFVREQKKRARHAGAAALPDVVTLLRSSVLKYHGLTAAIRAAPRAGILNSMRADVVSKAQTQLDRLRAVTAVAHAQQHKLLPERVSKLLEPDLDLNAILLPTIAPGTANYLVAARLFTRAARYEDDEARLRADAARLPGSLASMVAFFEARVQAARECLARKGEGVVNVMKLLELDTPPHGVAADCMLGDGGALTEAVRWALVDYGSRAATVIRDLKRETAAADRVAAAVAGLPVGAAPTLDGNRGPAALQRASLRALLDGRLAPAGFAAAFSAPAASALPSATPAPSPSAAQAAAATQTAGVEAAAGAGGAAASAEGAEPETEAGGLDEGDESDALEVDEDDSDYSDADDVGGAIVRHLLPTFDDGEDAEASDSGGDE
jgi:hypothetical protein